MLMLKSLDNCIAFSHRTNYPTEIEIDREMNGDLTGIDALYIYKYGLPCAGSRTVLSPCIHIYIINNEHVSQ